MFFQLFWHAFVAVVAPSAMAIISLIFMASNSHIATHTHTYQHTTLHSHPVCNAPADFLLLLSFSKPNNQRDMQIVQTICALLHSVLQRLLFHFQRQQGIFHSHIPTLLLYARFHAALLAHLYRLFATNLWNLSVLWPRQIKLNKIANPVTFRSPSFLLFVACCCTILFILMLLRALGPYRRRP